MGLFGTKKKTTGDFQFRVSDAVEVPLRGYLLRLKLASGDPAIDDLGPGKSIRLRAPDGAERTVTVKGWSATIGVPSQKRFDRTHELDLMIETADAIVNNLPVEIGWTVSGPT